MDTSSCDLKNRKTFLIIISIKKKIFFTLKNTAVFTK
jgi:hypothetical protein